MATPRSVTVTLNDLYLTLNDMGPMSSVSVAELFHRLGMVPKPTPDVVMDVNALKATLASLNLTSITADQLIEAVKKQEMNLSISSGFEQTNAVVGRFLNDSLQIQSEGFPPYKSTVTVNPGCSSEEKARRLKIRDLVRKEFPDGILEPYHTTPQLTQFDLDKMKGLR